jgi:uncharacterized Fe-S cluster protein YjdI
MTKVQTCAFFNNLVAAHAIAAIMYNGNFFGVNGFNKTWPACTAVKLIVELNSTSPVAALTYTPFW